MADLGNTATAILIPPIPLLVTGDGFVFVPRNTFNYSTEGVGGGHGTKLIISSGSGELPSGPTLKVRRNGVWVEVR